MIPSHSKTILFPCSLETSELQGMLLSVLLTQNIESAIAFVAKCWHVFRLFGLYITKSGPVVMAVCCSRLKVFNTVKIFHVVRIDWSHVGTD